MSSEKAVLYISGGRNVEVTSPDVKAGDVLGMECADRSLLPGIRAVKLLKFQKTGRQRCVVSILDIIAKIHGQYPRLDIRNLGETDIIVTYEDQKTPAPFWHIAKTLFVAAVTFFGAAFSIMAFNNDVDVTKLFGQISTFVTGEETDGFGVMEISYSAGVTAGILIFFNHFGRKRFTVDPTPMEIQMRLYENDIQTTLAEDAARKGEELDVGSGGTPDTSGIRRD